MKRIDKNKVYAFIGRAVVYTAFNLLLSAMLVWGFMSMTVYR